MKKIIILGVIFLVIFSAVDFSAQASAPYISYNYDRYGNAVPSQSGYAVRRTVSGKNLETGQLENPSDLFSDGENFYIADTGNNRIVVADSALEKTTAVYEKLKMPDGSFTVLDSPSGVFADGKSVYIADTGNERIIIINRDGEVVTEIKKPVSEIYDSGKTFMPKKIIADKSGNIYAVLGNMTSGCAVFSPDGEFTGFFGAENVSPTIENSINYVRNIFMSDRKKARRKRSVPSGTDNLDISGDFIFTCTSSEKSDGKIKKLNSAGKNIFDGRDIHFGDYKPKKNTSRYKVPDTKICDIDISAEGFINCIDSETGHIFQYDKEGSLLFIMGTLAEQSGGFTAPTAIETLGGNIYVLDSRKNNITVFGLTDFGKKVHEAVNMYNSGYYADSLGLWNEIIMRDGSYTYAYRGKAFALLRKGDYKNAMKYAEIAGDSDIYNKAFKEYRRLFFAENSGKIFFITAVSAVVFCILAKRRKRKK